MSTTVKERGSIAVDCSHGAFHGSSHWFVELRQFVCAVTGGSYPPHFNKANRTGQGFNGEGFVLEKLDGRYYWTGGGGMIKFLEEKPEGAYEPDDWYFGRGYNKRTHQGLFVFLTTDSSNGNIAIEDCKLVAEELEDILSVVQEKGLPAPAKPWSKNQIEMWKERGDKIPIYWEGEKGQLERFIRGLRRAMEAKECLVFS